MSHRPKFLILAVLALFALTAAVATAADPSSGRISKDSPSVEWTGLLAESAVMFNLFNNDDSAPCVPPMCDTFALEVADGPANVELSINLGRTGSSGDADAGFRITKPDDSIEWVSGPSNPDKAFKYVMKNAASGAYTIDVVDSFVGTPGGYSAKATLLVPGAPVAPAPGTPTGPTQQPGPSQGQEPLPKLTAKAGKASAKKLAKARKLAVKLTTSAPLTKLAAVMSKGKKTVGKGSLASLASKGTLSLKLPSRKLKPGKYQITVQGQDRQGRTVTATTSVKVAK